MRLSVFETRQSKQFLMLTPFLPSSFTKYMHEDVLSTFLYIKYIKFCAFKHFHLFSPQKTIGIALNKFKARKKNDSENEIEYYRGYNYKSHLSVNLFTNLSKFNYQVFFNTNQQHHNGAITLQHYFSSA